jgi:hypothetical protein
MLLDATLGLAIASYAIVNADMTVLRVAETNTAVQTGQYMTGLQAGVNKYIAVNGDSISGRTAAALTTPNGLPLTVAVKNAPTIAELMNGGFLPAGYTLQNPSKLNFAVAITPTNCPGVGCTLPAQISSSQYKDNQGNIRNDLLADAVTAAGLDGGQSLVSDPSHFTSAGKAWSLPNSNAVAGQLLMRAGSLTTGYVDTLPFYKLDGTRPLAGAMNANGQNINNAGSVTAANVAAAGTVSGAYITTPGTVQAGALNTGYVTTSGMTANGAVQVNGTITAGALSLPAGNTLTISATQWYGDTNGNAAIRVPGSLYLQGPNGSGYRGIIAQDGNFQGNMSVVGQVSSNTVVANGITSNGNINAGNNISANTMNANGITSNGNLAVGAAITANTVNANGITSNGDSYTAGNQTVNGVLTARNVVNLPALAYDGYGCSGNAITTDPNGHILSCQAGVWRASTTTNNVTNNYPTTYVYQEPSGRYVTSVGGGPCGGFIVYYSDGSRGTVMTSAGCSWN